MELFSLIGKIAIDSNGANKSIDDTIGKAEKSKNKFTDVFSKIGKCAVEVAKVGAVAVGTIATGIGVLTKTAIDNYAEYEQLVGGVETLFKSSSDKVIEYANNAYKTAGLSANEYMSITTSFSASLLQSLGGDTKKATESANLAITDMSDNANKMGTSMEMIQNAYQGFAKQNYTMLDNLKLGYGGTKEEMQRLLEDAEKLSGIKYDLSSFDDVVQAIHVVQTEMGITGTTALEASSTIQGSISSMGSAWKNFLTGMADPTQDFDKLLNNLIDSVLTVADNLVPRLISTLPRIIEGLSQLIQKIVPYLPGLIEKLLPPILEGATNLINTIIQNLPQIIEMLLPPLINALGSLLLTLGKMLPDLLKTAINIISTLATQISESLPEIIPVIVEIILEIVNTLLQNLDKIIEAAIKIIIALAEGLINAIPVLIEKIPTIVMSIVTAIIENAPLLIGAAAKLISVLVSGLIDGIGALIEAAIRLGTSIVDAISQKWEELKQKTAEKWEQIKTSVSGVMEKVRDSVVDKAKELKEKVVERFTELKEKAEEKFNELKKAAIDKIGEMKENVIQKVGELKEKTESKIKDLKEAASKKFEELKTNVIDTWESIKEKTSKVWENISTTASNKAQDIYTSVTGTFNNVVQGVSDSMGNIFQAVVDGFDSAIGFLKNLAGDAWTWGADMVNGFVDGIKSMIDNVIGAVSSVADTITSWLHFSVPDVGPLTEYESWMPDFMMGLAQGIEKNKWRVSSAIQGLAEDMVVPDINYSMNLNPRSGYRQDAASHISGSVDSKVGELFTELKKMIGIFSKGLDGAKVVLSTGETVGALAVPMSEELGKIVDKKGRGV